MSFCGLFPCSLLWERGVNNHSAVFLRRMISRTASVLKTLVVNALGEFLKTLKSLISFRVHYRHQPLSARWILVPWYWSPQCSVQESILLLVCTSVSNIVFATIVYILLFILRRYKLKQNQAQIVTYIMTLQNI